ncbi:MAG: hypothetical protein AAGK97_07585 [Bacteroidota bacterium]
MKIKSIFSLLLFVLPFIGISQECNLLIPLHQGLKYEYTSYDKKGKFDGKSNQEITFVEEDGNVINAEIAQVVTDKKGKEAFASNYQVRCEDGLYTIDLEQMLGPEILGGLGQNNPNEVEVSGTAMQLPRDLKVGQELEDADLNFSFGPLKGSMLIYDRKVTDRETVTTEAGTFDCYKIEYSSKVKMLIGKLLQVEEFYAEGVGMVKSNTYNAKGKLLGSSVLTKFEK